MKITHLIALPIVLASAAAVFSAEPGKNKWDAMDYGPFLSLTLNMGKETNGRDGAVMKTTIVRLGDKEHPVCVAYDTELMRVAAVWSGGFIDYNGVIFNGNHHAQPRPKGKICFAGEAVPQWASKEFVDPRPDHRGPLPQELFHFQGMGRSGNRVYFAYSVNGKDVLEFPSLARDEKGEATFVREMTTAGNFPENKILKTNLGDGTVTESKSANTPDLPALANGGPLLWPETIETKGTLGKDDAPYTVDTLTIPEKNPWNSWMRLGGFDFFADGKRAAVCTWSGDVWIVSGIDDALGKLTWKRFAAGLYQPLGLKIVDDKIYCTCRDRIVKLHDLNNDGEADFYESFNSDFILSYHFHEFMMDLQTDAEGNFYFAKGGTPGVGGPNFDIVTPHNGCFFKLSKDGKKLEVVARGLRAPNGIGVGPHGELSSGDNEGSWVPVCPINEIKAGGFVGVVPEGWPDQPPPEKRDPPICWLPWNVDNSAGCQVWATSKKWGPLENEMLHLSYGKASLFHVMTERIDGVLQGGVAKLPLQFASGIMRARFNPADGQMYVCGLKGWQTTAAQDGTFQRVRYTGKAVNLPAELHVAKEGVNIAFTGALDKAYAEDVSNYAVWWFNVKWTKNYGSDRWSPTEPNKKWEKGAVNPPGESIAVKSAKLSDDGKTVFLEIPGIKPVTNMIIDLKIQAVDGSKIQQQICNTIHNLPR